jgi:hypothetical protein
MVDRVSDAQCRNALGYVPTHGMIPIYHDVVMGGMWRNDTSTHKWNRQRKKERIRSSMNEENDTRIKPFIRSSQQTNLERLTTYDPGSRVSANR